MAYILIADDDELIAELTADILIDAGHACGWVTSGEQAWELLQKKRPDVILLDQDMPGISGVSLLRKIRQSPNLYDLPVIMFTAMSGAQDENQAMFAGAQDFVRKPFDPVALTRRIQRVLSRREKLPRHMDLQTYLARSSGLEVEFEEPARRYI